MQAVISGGLNHYWIPHGQPVYKFELGGPSHEACAGVLAITGFLQTLAGAHELRSLCLQLCVAHSHAHLSGRETLGALLRPALLNVTLSHAQLPHCMECLMPSQSNDAAAWVTTGRPAALPAALSLRQSANVYATVLMQWLRRPPCGRQAAAQHSGSGLQAHQRCRASSAAAAAGLPGRAEGSAGKHPCAGQCSAVNESSGTQRLRRDMALRNRCVPADLVTALHCTAHVLCCPPSSGLKSNTEVMWAHAAQACSASSCCTGVRPAGRQHRGQGAHHQLCEQGTAFRGAGPAAAGAGHCLPPRQLLCLQVGLPPLSPAGHVWMGLLLLASVLQRTMRPDAVVYELLLRAGWWSG